MKKIIRVLQVNKITLAGFHKLVSGTAYSNILFAPQNADRMALPYIRFGRVS